MHDYVSYFLAATSQFVNWRIWVVHFVQVSCFDIQSHDVVVLWLSGFCGIPRAWIFTWTTSQAPAPASAWIFTSSFFLDYPVSEKDMYLHSIAIKRIPLVIYLLNSHLIKKLIRGIYPLKPIYKKNVHELILPFRLLYVIIKE